MRLWLIPMIYVASSVACGLGLPRLEQAYLASYTLGLSVASAHGHTEVGDYELVIGFHNEPAYQSEPNGLDLFVTNKKTGEKVNDLADTLKVEIIFGSSKKELKIRPQWGEDGAYTADVLPTVAGDYTWHIWGAIKGTPVDVSMTSSPSGASREPARSMHATGSRMCSMTSNIAMTSKPDGSDAARKSPATTGTPASREAAAAQSAAISTPMASQPRERACCRKRP